MNNPYRPVSVTVGIVSIVIGGIIVAMSIGFSSISAGGILDVVSIGIIEWGNGDTVIALNVSVGSMLAIAGVSLLTGRGRAIAVSAGTGVCIISLTGLALYPTSSLTPPPRALVPLGVVGLIAMLSGTSLNGLQNHDG